MTNLEAIAKAKAVNLQEVLGVPIVPSVMLERHIKIPASYLEEMTFDRTSDYAEAHAANYLELLLEVARASMAENHITQLSLADIVWLELSPRTPGRGLYQLYLRTAP